MTPINNPLEVYKLLPKTNCRHCQMRTCLSFADAVIKGQKKINDCPHLDSNTIEQFGGKIVQRIDTIELHKEELVAHLKKQIAAIDLSSSAERLGALYKEGKLAVKVLGKDYFIDPRGNVASDCHINFWVIIPLLNYVLYSKGTEPAGKWVAFRELKGGPIMATHFEHKSEKPLKEIADKSTDLFGYILSVFGGRPVRSAFSSDLALVLYPLPKLPIVYTYSSPVDGLDSNFNMFFDINAEDNLDIELIHMLGTGITSMVEKISQRHA